MLVLSFVHLIHGISCLNRQSKNESVFCHDASSFDLWKHIQRFWKVPARRLHDPS